MIAAYARIAATFTLCTGILLGAAPARACPEGPNPVVTLLVLPVGIALVPAAAALLGASTAIGGVAGGATFVGTLPMRRSDPDRANLITARVALAPIQLVDPDVGVEWLGRLERRAQ